MARPASRHTLRARQCRSYAIFQCIPFKKPAWLLLFLAFWRVTPLQCASSVEDPEGEHLLSLIRARAVEYESMLKDLVCTQAVVRTRESRRGSDSKLMDTSEWEVTYTDHHESRRVLSVNGKPEKKMGMRQGFVPGSEFAALFRNTFDPRVGTEFSWEHRETGDPRVCAFRLRVPQNTSHIVHSSNHNLKKTHVRLGFRGVLYADCNSGAVTRLHLTTDLPANAELSEEIDIRYRLTFVGGAELMLPSHVEETIQTRNDEPTRVNIEFVHFRRFAVESEVRLQ